MNEYVQALLTALGMSGLSFLAGAVIVRFGERSIERKHGMIGIKQKLVQRAKMEQRLDSRKVERARKLKDADDETRTVASRKSRLDRQLKDAMGAGDQLIRIIGEETNGTPCFIAQVLNKYVGTPGFQQKQHAYIDRSWASHQMIEVWTRSMTEARTEIERRYPPAFGFVIARLQEPGEINSPAAKKKH